VQDSGNPDTMTGLARGIAPTRTNDIVGAILYGCPNWPRNFRPDALVIANVLLEVKFCSRSQAPASHTLCCASMKAFLRCVWEREQRVYHLHIDNFRCDNLLATRQVATNPPRSILSYYQLL